jgi:hypothetical protein
MVMRENATNAVTKRDEKISREKTCLRPEQERKERMILTISGIMSYDGVIK